MSPDRLDEAIAALPILEPPDELVHAVLDNLGPQEHRSRRPANRWWVVASVAALAAVALVALSLPAPELAPADPDDLVTKGVEDGVGTVGLRMSVLSGDRLDRFRRGADYPAGDTLLFHADAAPGGWLHLVRIDADGARVVHTQGAASGDLLTNGQPLGYELEQGEKPAVYALIGHDQRLDDVSALAVGADAAAVCRAARAAGWACAAERVQAVR